MIARLFAALAILLALSTSSHAFMGTRLRVASNSTVPSGLTVSAYSIAGGTNWELIGGAGYYFKVSFFDGSNVESAKSNEVFWYNLVATKYPGISFNAVPGASKYRIYVSLTSGDYSNAYYLDVTSTTTNTWTDRKVGATGWVGSGINTTYAFTDGTAAGWAFGGTGSYTGAISNSQWYSPSYAATIAIGSNASDTSTMTKTIYCAATSVSYYWIATGSSHGYVYMDGVLQDSIANNTWRQGTITGVPQGYHTFQFVSKVSANSSVGIDDIHLWEGPP